MKPTLKLAEAFTPEGEPLELLSHDGSFRIQSGRLVLRSSRAHSSERELGRLGMEPFIHCRSPRLVLAGLGLGYPLAAVLETLGKRRCTIEVAEPNADIVDWHRTHLATLHGENSLLADGKVSIYPDSIDNLLWSGKLDAHSLLLPLDCDPDDSMALSDAGLTCVRDGLREGGLLGILASHACKRLEARLKHLGFTVESQAIKASAQAKKGRIDMLYIATAPPSEDNPARRRR